MSGTTFATVMEGMSEVTENGTASDVFKNYSIHVGGKTGSAQVSKGSSNSIFAAFAPFEDPEIAVVVVVEHGGSGNRIAPIARKIFDVYFNLDKELSQKNQENSFGVKIGQSFKQQLVSIWQHFVITRHKKPVSAGTSTLAYSVERLSRSIAISG